MTTKGPFKGSDSPALISELNLEFFLKLFNFHLVHHLFLKLTLNFASNSFNIFILFVQCADIFFLIKNFPIIFLSTIFK